MNYALLEQWIIEHAALSGQLKQVRRNDTYLYLDLSTRQTLVFKYSGTAPLLYLSSKDEPTDISATRQLWQMLKVAQIMQLTLAPDDRIVYVHLTKTDMFNQTQEYTLIFECMPPKPNVILCKAEAEHLTVVDALHTYTLKDNPQRQILPHHPYEPPRTRFLPSREPVVFPLYLTLPQTDEPATYTSVNDYITDYDQKVLAFQEGQHARQSLLQHWKKELNKAQKKQALQMAELMQAEQEGQWLMCSELLKANLTKIRKGDTSLTTVNYYDPNLSDICIDLLPDKTPVENLHHYLKKYRKAKHGKEIIAEQLAMTNQTIARIAMIIQSIEENRYDAGELMQGKTQEVLQRLSKADKLLRLPIHADWDIVIGRKATENDFISTQLGKPQDWWFHTRVYRGSHILLRNYKKKEPPALLIEVCCGLAAWFSKARHSQNVPVDYTQIRYVRKPRKSAPGYVTYTTHKTLFINPIDIPAARGLLSTYAG